MQNNNILQWKYWPVNQYTGLVVKTKFDLKFTKPQQQQEKIPSNTKGIVLMRCWFETDGKGCEVYHVHFPNCGAVYIATEDIEFV